MSTFSPSCVFVTILIDLSSAERLNTGESIQKVLQTVYNIRVPHVQVRSCELPAGRFDSFHIASSVIYVGIGPPETPLFVHLKEHSVHPVLILSSDTPAEAAALQIAKVVALASPDVAACVTTQVKSRRSDDVSKQQRLLSEDAERVTTQYADKISLCYDSLAQITGDRMEVMGAKRFRGKVRDRWEKEGLNVLAMVTTDRQSGFDRQLAVVPFKGAVLNLCSAFWFKAVADIIPNHLVSIPHPSVAVVRRCEPFPIEFVVRSYMTGSTSTSIWKNYQNGVRNYCGHDLPEGMTKNQKLPHNLLTPTTKEEEHDRPISLADICSESHMTASDLDVCAKAALAVFARGQAIAAEHGLILVDTKYEFGRCCVTGDILLIDEVHTPDSSRYWLASSASQRIAAGKEPENIDKEFLRLWFRDHCDPYKDEAIPDAPRDLVLELSRRYVQLYEMITWTDFDFAAAQQGEDVISEVVQNAFAEASTVTSV